MDTARVRIGAAPVDRAGAVVAVLRADIGRAVRHGLLTSSESAELLARLTTVVDQALGPR
jgi:hypothetical protein